MSSTVQRLLAEGVPACVQMYFDSFQNAHSLAYWPRVPAIPAFWEAMFINEMEEAASHFIKAVDLKTVCQNGRRSRTVDLCNETFGMWAKQHRELMQDRGHWYLEIVGTSPKFQREGAGSKLLQYGCELADEEGVVAFLEAAPDALPLYLTFGFQTAAAMHTLIKSPEGGIYTETFMIREPSMA